MTHSSVLFVARANIPSLEEFAGEMIVDVVAT